MAEKMDEISFEEALKELETIVEKLEGGEVKLAEAIALYERGALLRKRCETLLQEAKTRVKKISFPADAPLLTDFDPKQHDE